MVRVDLKKVRQRVLVTIRRRKGLEPSICPCRKQSAHDTHVALSPYRHDVAGVDVRKFLGKLANAPHCVLAVGDEAVLLSALGAREGLHASADNRIALFNLTIGNERC